MNYKTILSLLNVLLGIYGIYGIYKNNSSSKLPEVPQVANTTQDGITQHGITPLTCIFGYRVLPDGYKGCNEQDMSNPDQWVNDNKLDDNGNKRDDNEEWSFNTAPRAAATLELQKFTSSPATCTTATDPDSLWTETILNFGLLSLTIILLKPYFIKTKQQRTIQDLDNARTNFYHHLDHYYASYNKKHVKNVIDENSLLSSIIKFITAMDKYIIELNKQFPENDFSQVIKGNVESHLETFVNNLKKEPKIGMAIKKMITERELNIGIKSVDIKTYLSKKGWDICCSPNEAQRKKHIRANTRTAQQRQIGIVMRPI